MSKGTICIDFDGVICQSKGGWVDITEFKPIKGAFETIVKLRLRGFDVIVCSARPVEQVGTWLFQNWPRVAPYGDVPECTNKKPHALVYVDDHALLFKNWDQAWEDLKPLMK